MNDFLAQFYPWIKALHIVSVISWMAGLLYLPRLFAYHMERVEPGTPVHELFTTMESRLLRIIMTPAMLLSWLFGMMLALTPGILDWQQFWPWTKLGAIVLLTSFHFWLAGKRKEIESGFCRTMSRTFRILNELPTILMIVIIVSIVVRPF